jgi:hypothetical protein
MIEKMIDQAHQVEHNGRSYTFKHGDPFDRGMSDSYYGRIRNPHKGGVGGDSGPRVESNEMSLQEVADYGAGYNYNESTGEKKSWD